MKEDKLSIIIVAHNEEKFLPKLLRSLSRQSFKSFEIIIVDSHSSDRTKEYAMKYKHAFPEFSYLLLDDTPGPATGRNKGAALANYPRLLFLDSDTILPPDFLEKSLAEIDRKHADLASGRARIAENHPLSRFGIHFLNFFMILLYPRYLSAYGACLFSTKDIHDRIGGFDESLGICEDCHYVKKAVKTQGLKYLILKAFFYTTDRRAKAEGGIPLMLKYIKSHLYRMITGKEIPRNKITYTYELHEK
ncbi:glycosyltransferase family 2 protein [Fidelibacter multiformis]|jgi:glycosyltransferase involved in cell wall biosynthesis|uniref:glycosyltransferase family 2 protein n=1 Tax=Fidelibacter multiformis TaxID=3377529 RepID=UPI0037DC6A0A